MTKQTIIDRTIDAINHLPEDKAEEIFEFADFVRKRFEEQRLTKDIQTLAADSTSFEFLNAEEEDYTLSDLKQVFDD